MIASIPRSSIAQSRRPSSTTTRIETDSQMFLGGPAARSRRPSSTTTRIETVDEYHPQHHSHAADDRHPQQQGLKPRDTVHSGNTYRGRRPSSTTTRIETIDKNELVAEIHSGPTTVIHNNKD